MRERRKFKNAKYNQACQDPSLQFTFIKTCREFDGFCVNFNSVSDFINLDIRKMFVEAFGNWDDEVCCLDAEEEYQRNYETMNLNRLFEDEIANNEQVQTMIYFGQTDNFKIWMEGQQKVAEIEPEDDPYAKSRGVVPQTSEITYSLQNDRSSGSNIGGIRGAFIQSVSDKRTREKKVIGNKGALLIYNLLCERHGADRVYPRSEAFVELGILKAGQAVSGDYDLSYVDEDGTEFFVEVKAGSSNSFSISEKELSFAMEFPSKYQLFVVYDLDKEIPQCTEIPMEFWNDKNFRRTDIIERIEYHF